MILEPFGTLFECDGRTHARTDGGQAGPARPAPRAWISSRVRASPPHSNNDGHHCNHSEHHSLRSFPRQAFQGILGQMVITGAEHSCENVENSGN